MFRGRLHSFDGVGLYRIPVTNSWQPLRIWTWESEARRRGWKTVPRGWASGSYRSALLPLLPYQGPRYFVWCAALVPSYSAPRSMRPLDAQHGCAACPVYEHVPLSCGCSHFSRGDRRCEPTSRGLVDHHSPRAHPEKTYDSVVKLYTPLIRSANLAGPPCSAGRVCVRSLAPEICPSRGRGHEISAVLSRHGADRSCSRFPWFFHMLVGDASPRPRRHHESIPHILAATHSFGTVGTMLTQDTRIAAALFRPAGARASRKYGGDPFLRGGLGDAKHLEERYRTHGRAENGSCLALQTLFSSTWRSIAFRRRCKAYPSSYHPRSSRRSEAIDQERWQDAIAIFFVSRHGGGHPRVSLVGSRELV